ncbi:ribbon-helix-helix domain-containing protein [Candidatus Methanomassiliicoccus intestinalis]|jgi:hypothetical protein|uniref:Ribbon-helix-helix protein CopG domain-containing protein n=1 Tax=Candidatus Methanomassiliicoccus intestinalis TaxID=1406512 RepID=A0A8J8TDV5_9ARCH|nr:MAG: hypothetical protein A3207_06375 [Candidatus Methanomassiliicoccus intestinalis]
MVRRTPAKSAVRLMLPDELIARLDKAVDIGVFSSRNELLLYLIRNHIDHLEDLEKSQMEYKYKLWNQQKRKE